MTTQHDERAMLIERLTFLANSDSGLSVIAQDTCRKAAALLAADGQAGGEAVALHEKIKYGAQTYGPLLKAAIDLLAAVDARHDQPDPLKYTIPYGAVNALRDAINTHPQPQAVAQGWKLVPVEPTPKMISAAWQQGSVGGWDMEGPEPIYRAMLDASPAEPAAAQDIDWLPHDDRLRFVQRVLESDAPKADRNSAAKMVRDMRLSIRPAAAQVADWRDGVNVARLRAALTRMGVATEPSEEGMAADLENWVNTLTRAVTAGKPAAQVAPGAVPDGWQSKFEELLEDYAGARAETAVFNATQRSGMTVRMAHPRLKRLLEHVAMLSAAPKQQEPV